MPYINVLIHYVWSTKDRHSILTKHLRSELFTHIRLYAQSQGIYIDRINGHLDHVHCFVSLKPGQSIDKVAQLIKGESTYWFNNKSKLTRAKLEWQNDYFAIGVSPSQADRVRAYIDNQEEHHKKITFTREYEELMKQFGFYKSKG